MRSAPKLPAKVRVAHRVFSLVLTPNEQLGDDTRGDCNIFKARIRISDDLTPQDTVETVLHELIHAMWPDRAIVGHKDVVEEEVAIEMGRGFTQVIRDNPELFAWISHTLT